MTDISPSKPVATSLTIQGVVVSLIGAFTPQIATWLHLPEADITKIVAAAVTLIGAIMSVVGRMRASQPLH